MEGSEFVAIDLNSACRICLIQEGEVPIFGDKPKNEDECPLSIRISYFSFIEMIEGDGFPTLICNRCLHQINQAFAFKMLCESSDSALRNFFFNFVCKNNDDDNSGKTKELNPETIGKIITSSKVIVRGKENEMENNGALAGIFISDDKESGIFILDSSAEDVMVKEFLKMEASKPIETVEPSISDGEESNQSVNLTDYEECDDVLREKNYITGAVCTICLRKFSSNEELHFHVKSHGVTGQLSCNKCDKVFPHFRLLRLHKDTHSTEGSHICIFCGQKFLRLHSLKRHEDRHREKKKSICKFCGKLKCVHCVRRGESQKRYCCDVCGKTFVRRTALVTHIKRHNASEERFQCQKCKQQFFSNHELDRHTRVHLGIKPFSCPKDDCSHNFYSQGELNRHLRYHNGEKKFSCDICGQRFFESGHLVIHKRIHTGEKPFVCEICSKSFITSSKLARHLKTHSSPIIKFSAHKNKAEKKKLKNKIYIEKVSEEEKLEKKKTSPKSPRALMMGETTRPDARKNPENWMFDDTESDIEDQLTM